MMKKVSQSFMASCDGAVPSSPMPPVAYGLSSGNTALPSRALATGAASFSAACVTASRACKAPRPVRMATFLPALRMSAAFCSSSRDGSGLAAAKVSPLWPAMFMLERGASSVVHS